MLKSAARALMNRMGYHLRALDDLTRLMNEAGSDKGLGLRGRHFYTRVYHGLFSRYRDQPITFVEIGLLRADRDSRRERGAAEGASQARAYSAPSLQAWRKYFSRATIVGFDIDDFSGVNLPGTTILQGDMSNKHDLRRLVAACPDGRIDVVIDDGSHASHHQQLAFAELFPHVKPGGLYCIEDCHWQDPVLEAANAVPTREVLHAFRKTGELQSDFIEAAVAARLAREMESVQFHDSIEPCIDDTEDALCVIKKRM